jgi:hypothetical protein
VDLVVRGGKAWHLVEAKSAQTVDDSFFRHLQGPAEGMGGSAAADMRLVYGGDTRATRSQVEIVPWRDLQTPGWA